MPSNAFNLTFDDQGLATVGFDLPERKVNLFTREALEELEALTAELGRRTDIRGLLLVSGKEGSFCHGLDLAILAALTEGAEAEAGAHFGRRLMAAWEALPFPTVAVLDGPCLGSGMELALACTWRVASDREDVRMGFPEIRLGTIPAWGGSARLQRQVGLKAALDLILTGHSLGSRKAGRLGLVDAVVAPAALLSKAGGLALHSRQPEPEPVQEREESEALLGRAEEKVRSRGGGHYPAPLRFLEAARIALQHEARSEEVAEAVEIRAVGELVTGVVCKNLLHMFRLTHEAKRHPAFEPRPVLSVPPRPATIDRAGVVGAGVMGRGISALLVQAGLPVTLKDLRQETLDAALEQVARLVENRRSRRRLSPTEARRAPRRLQATLDYGDFADAQLVVEAIPERLPDKRQVLADLAVVVSPTTILASNASSLSIDALAEGIPHPERVLGLHFLNPAHRMPLVEIVAGRHTAPEVTAAAVGLIHRLGKTAVAVRNAPGFLVNRLLTFYLSGALWLLDEGRDVGELDRILTDWGMPQGPFALMDRVGIDLAVEVGRHLMEALGERLAFPDWDWEGVFLDPGRLGQKSGAGFYRYESGRRLAPDPQIPLRLGLPTPSGTTPDPQQVVDRLLLPMVDEAARCLEEGVVAGPADVDVAVLLGLGFPPFRGGLCRWADQRGPADIVETLPAPSDALRRLAEKGGFYGNGASGPRLA